MYNRNRNRERLKKQIPENKSPRGGIAYTQHLKCCAFGIAGAGPVGGTQ